MNREITVYLVAGILVLILGPFAKLAGVALIVYAAFLFHEQSKKQDDAKKNEDSAPSVDEYAQPEEQVEPNLRF